MRRFAFTVELTQMAMAIVVFFGVGLVTHEDAPYQRRCRDIAAAAAMARGCSRPSQISWRSAFSRSMVWRLWGHAEFLYGKGDTTMVWTVPLWPVAFAVALGSIFLLTGVCCICST